jgi:hypothetical protein
MCVPPAFAGRFTARGRLALHFGVALSPGRSSVIHARPQLTGIISDVDDSHHLKTEPLRLDAPAESMRRP